MESNDSYQVSARASLQPITPNYTELPPITPNYTSKVTRITMSFAIRDAGIRVRFVESHLQISTRRPPHRRCTMVLQHNSWVYLAGWEPTNVPMTRDDVVKGAVRGWGGLGPQEVEPEQL